MTTQTNIRFAAIITLIALALAAATAPAAESATKPTDPNCFNSNKDGFSITVPARWEKLADQLGISVFFMEPQQGAADTFRENFNVVVKNLPTGMNLNAYAKASQAGIAKATKEFKLVSSKRALLGKLPAQRLVVRHKASGHDLKVLCYVAVNGARGYSVNCTTTVAKFGKYEPVFEDICKTFRSFEPAPPKPQVFTSEKDGFSITTPASWELRKGQNSVVVTLLEPQAHAMDNFRENVNVVVVGLPPGMGLDQYVKSSSEMVPKSLGEFKLVSSTRTKLGKNSTKRVVFQHKMAIYNLKVLNYTVVTGGKAYMLTCTATAVEYDKHENIFEDVCKTFQAFEPGKDGSKEGKKAKGKISPDSL